MANLCVICLESVLSGTTVGATSCGHLFHTECFAQWRDSQQGGRGRSSNNVKCPTCNVPVQLFHPLYVDFGAVFQIDEEDDEDDDDDEESIESDPQEEDEGEKEFEADNEMEGAEGGGAKKKRQRNDDLAQEEEQEDPTETIIVFDDEVALVERRTVSSPPLGMKKTPPARETKKTPSPARSNVARRRRRKLAKYKAYVKRQNQTIVSLQKLVDELKASDIVRQNAMQQLNDRIDEQEDERQCLEDANGNLQRQRTVLAEELRIAQHQLQVTTADKHDLAEQLQRFQTRKRLESSSNMTEVRRCMAERPQLLAQIKTLQLQLLAVQRTSSSSSTSVAPQQQRLSSATAASSKNKHLLNQLDAKCQEQKQLFHHPVAMDMIKYSKRASDMMLRKQQNPQPRVVVGTNHTLGRLLTATTTAPSMLPTKKKPAVPSTASQSRR
jgi:hypothetical protein